MNSKLWPAGFVPVKVIFTDYAFFFCHDLSKSATNLQKLGSNRRTSVLFLYPAVAHIYQENSYLSIKEPVLKSIFAK